MQDVAILRIKIIQTRPIRSLSHRVADQTEPLIAIGRYEQSRPLVQDKRTAIRVVCASLKNLFHSAVWDPVDCESQLIS
jgi:hypothetical protein